MLRLLIATVLARSAAAGTYAVVIGHNDPPAQSAETLSPLRFADDDAARFHELFQRMGAHVDLLSVFDDRTQRRYPRATHEAREPSLENLRQTMERFRRAMKADRDHGKETRFFLTYSGHGARSTSGEAFLTLADGEITEVVLFDEILKDLPASYSHVIVDACNASGVLGVRGLFDREVDAVATPVGADEIARASRLAEFPSVGVILASTEGSASHEWSEVESGVFTHEVLSALTGAADINRDHLIEYSEVHAFVAAANRDLADPRAMPQVVARAPRINRRVPLLALDDLQGVSFLQGSPGKLGRFSIELENGQRYLDAHLGGDLKAKLSVPSGTSYVRTDKGEARVRLRPGATLAFAQLSFGEPRSAQRGSIEQSFHDKLFESSYSAEYYRGFVDQAGEHPVDFAVARSAPSSKPRSRTTHWWLLGAAGALLTAAVTSTVIALKARQSFDETDLQGPAHEHADRYRLASGVAIGTGAAAALTGLGAWYFWP